MDIESLKAAGFKEYESPTFSKATKLFQKAVTTRHGTKLYFINVQMWDHSKYAVGMPIGWDAEANLYMPEDERAWVVLQVHGIEEWTVKYLEDFYYQNYLAGEYVPDRHNNDQET